MLGAGLVPGQGGPQPGQAGYINPVAALALQIQHLNQLAVAASSQQSVPSGSSGSPTGGNAMSPNLPTPTMNGMNPTFVPGTYAQQTFGINPLGGLGGMSIGLNGGGLGMSMNGFNGLAGQMHANGLTQAQLAYLQGQAQAQAQGQQAPGLAFAQHALAHQGDAAALYAATSLPHFAGESLCFLHSVLQSLYIVEILH